jgi:hypothetical protein
MSCSASRTSSIDPATLSRKITGSVSADAKAVSTKVSGLVTCCPRSRNPSSTGVFPGRTVPSAG